MDWETREKRAMEATKTLKFQPFRDTWDGISDENLFVMGGEYLYDEIMDKKNFVDDENYNYKTDPQLIGMDSIQDKFYV